MYSNLFKVVPPNLWCISGHGGLWPQRFAAGRLEIWPELREVVWKPKFQQPSNRSNQSNYSNPSFSSLKMARSVCGLAHFYTLPTFFQLIFSLRSLVVMISALRLRSCHRFASDFWGLVCLGHCAAVRDSTGDSGRSTSLVWKFHNHSSPHRLRDLSSLYNFFSWSFMHLPC